MPEERRRSAGPNLELTLPFGAQVAASIEGFFLDAAIHGPANDDRSGLKANIDAKIVTARCF
jgi:hypothetical protein